MKKLFKKEIYIKLIVIGLLIYVISIFANQQKSLNLYKNQETMISSLIEEQKELKEDLAIKKSNIDSTEYIEEIAREKLDMYLPNEKVYIDRNK